MGIPLVEEDEGLVITERGAKPGEGAESIEQRPRLFITYRWVGEERHSVLSVTARSRKEDSIAAEDGSCPVPRPAIILVSVFITLLPG